MNLDGRIDTTDATLILQYTALIITLLPPVPPNPLPTPATGTLSIEQGIARTGEKLEFSIVASDITQPGAGAWTLDVAYDHDLVSVTSCDARGGVCNPGFGDGVLRLAGVSTTGYEGTEELATIGLRCGNSEGSSELSLTPDLFVDSTIGAPQPIDAAIVDGEIECWDGSPLEDVELSVQSTSVLTGDTVTVGLELSAAPPGVSDYAIDVVYSAELLIGLGCSDGIAEDHRACWTERDVVWFKGWQYHGLRGQSTLGTMTFRAAENACPALLSVQPYHVRDPFYNNLEPTVFDGTITIEPAPDYHPSGDTNCDYEVDSVDAALILQVSADLIPALPYPVNGDVTRDGDINPLDAAIILQLAAGWLDELP